MGVAVWVWAGVAVAIILFPIFVASGLQRSRWFRSVMWSARERDYPMPQADWTVADLRAHAERNLESVRYNDPRWPDDDEKPRLRALIRSLDTRPPQAPLSPADIDTWLTIRDLRGT